MKNKGSKTRQDIVSKALMIFSVKGYYNTSINDLLGATGLTKGGLYGHFQNKEAIWDAAYEEAVRLWREIVFKDLQEISDPIERIERLILNDMRDYLGEDIFPGGCFFLNMLVELSGQADPMKNRILQGFEGVANLLASWLREAEEMGLLRKGLDLGEISHFILTALNGTAALYAATHNPSTWQLTISQLHNHLEQLRTGAQSR